MNHLSPQPEAAELARELRDKPDALHALRVLNEAANRDDEEPAPPIPEDLRERWNARFGEKREAEPTLVARLAAWWRQLTETPYILGGGLVAALALILGIASKTDPTMRGAKSNDTLLFLVVGESPTTTEIEQAFPGAKAEKIPTMLDDAPLRSRANERSRTVIVVSAAEISYAVPSGKSQTRAIKAGESWQAAATEILKEIK